MEVYLDILFFTNFAADFLVLKICADILNLKFRFFRTFIASVLGGIFGSCIFVPDLSMFFSVLSVSVIAGIMIYISFPPCNIREFLKRIAVMYVTSAVFSGAVLFDITNRGGIVKNGVFYTNTPRVLLVCSGVYCMIRFFVLLLKRRSSLSCHEVIIEFMEKRIKCNSFLDTGNGLFDPISGKPVILIEDTVLKKLVNENCSVENIYEWVSSDKIRLIPYKTIDHEGVLFGLILDRIYINGRCVEDTVAAISDKSLKYPVILNAGI